MKCLGSNSSRKVLSTKVAKIFKSLILALKVCCQFESQMLSKVVSIFEDSGHVAKRRYTFSFQGPLTLSHLRCGKELRTLSLSSFVSLSTGRNVLPHNERVFFSLSEYPFCIISFRFRLTGIRDNPNNHLIYNPPAVINLRTDKNRPKHSLKKAPRAPQR